MNIIQEIEQEVQTVASEIGDWFNGEAKTAETLYDTLTNEEKQAQTWGLGVIAVVNANLDKDASLIIPLVQKVFPSLDLTNLQGFVEELLSRAQIFIKGDVPLTLVDAINQLSTYLKTITAHTFWGQVSQALGNELTIIISPTSVIQKIMATAELAYQIIVKPKVSSLT